MKINEHILLEAFESTDERCGQIMGFECITEDAKELIIRDLSLPMDEQIVWRVDLNLAHARAAMNRKIDLLRFGIVSEYLNTKYGSKDE